jgi:hypothetical protein
MPNTSASRYWFVRVDGPQEYLSSRVKILSVECEMMLAVFHTGKSGENSHMHFICVTNKEIQKQSWDVKIKKHFDVSKKSDYSSKVWDGKIVDEGAATYLFHESLDSPILCSKGVSEDQVSGIKRIARTINIVIANAKEKAETKIPGKVLTKWKEAGKPDWSTTDIVTHVVKMAQAGECYLPKSDFQWKAYVEEVKLGMCETPDQLYTFIQRTVHRILA